jgi:hypothetical protein
MAPDGEATPRIGNGTPNQRELNEKSIGEAICQQRQRLIIACCRCSIEQLYGLILASFVSLTDTVQHFGNLTASRILPPARQLHF